MKIACLTFNPIQENTYVVWDDTKECAVIDAGNSTPKEDAALDGFLAERPGGRVVLVLVKGISNAGRRERLDGAGGATAVVFAMFTSHDPSVGRVRE